MKSRPGCELVLAWVSRCTGLTAHQVFMPVILAFHLGMLLAAAFSLLSIRGQILYPLLKHLPFPPQAE